MHSYHTHTHAPTGKVRTNIRTKENTTTEIHIYLHLGTHTMKGITLRLGRVSSTLIDVDNNIVVV